MVISNDQRSDQWSSRCLLRKHVNLRPNYGRMYMDWEIRRYLAETHEKLNDIISWATTTANLLIMLPSERYLTKSHRGIANRVWWNRLSVRNRNFCPKLLHSLIIFPRKWILHLHQIKANVANQPIRLWIKCVKMMIMLSRVFWSSIRTVHDHRSLKFWSCFQ